MRRLQVTHERGGRPCDGDQPVDASEVNRREGAEERFDAYESHGSTDVAEVSMRKTSGGVLRADGPVP